METIIQTPRLKLRQFRNEDAIHLYNLNSNPNVIKYTGDKAFQNIKQARRFIAAYDQYEKHGFGRWAVLDVADDTFLGWCGLKLNENKEVDIGFRFFQHFWGKGFATEAAKACILHGKNLGLREIIGRTSKENLASIRVLEKLGMKFWKNDHCKGIKDAKYFKIQTTHL